MYFVHFGSTQDAEEAMRGIAASGLRIDDTPVAVTFSTLHDPDGEKWDFSSNGRRKKRGRSPKLVRHAILASTKIHSAFVIPLPPLPAMVDLDIGTGRRKGSAHLGEGEADRPWIPEPQPRPPTISEGFEWDGEQGKYFDPDSRYLYDPNTMIYTQIDTGQHFRLDLRLRQYYPVDERGVRLDDPENLAATAAAAALEHPGDAGEAAGGTEADGVAEAAGKGQKTVKKKKKKKQPKGPISFKLGTVKPRTKALLVKARRANASHEAAASDEKPSEPTSSSSASAEALPGHQSGSATPAPAAGATSGVTEDSFIPPAELAKDPRLDFSRVACLLCQRKLKTPELLVKHVQFSKLHQRNLASEAREKEVQEYRRQQRIASETTMASIERLRQEMDRKRRQEELSKQLEADMERVQQQQDRAAGKRARDTQIGASNIGHRMMQKMGWTGSGLGKEERGRTAPIPVTGLGAGETAGLGSRSAGALGDGGAEGYDSEKLSYSEQLRRRAAQRFSQSKLEFDVDGFANANSASGEYLEQMKEFNQTYLADDSGPRPMLK